MNRNKVLSTILAAVFAFAVYTCMFAFRKPFTASSYEGIAFLGVNYKVWLVIAQTIGYTLAKFYGIRFMAELKAARRKSAILTFIGLAWLSLLLYALLPAPYNMICFVLNGFPLGMIYGLVFSYLEGRRTTEFLGAVLATSFIFAAGFTQSIGKHIETAWGISLWWMPFVTGAIFLLPTLVFTLLLDRTPEPDKGDREARTKRIPMTVEERKAFISRFKPGLALLVCCYVLLTILRDYRSNFASNIWMEIGAGQDASVYTRTELPASLVTLILMSTLVLVKSNIRALLVNHWIVIIGFLISIGATLLFHNNAISPYWWMSLTGVGLYMGYVPFNAMLFDRLLASFRHPGTAGFIIYIADSFAYLGSDAVLLAKSFLNVSLTWSGFFGNIILALSGLGIVLVGCAAFYFRAKHAREISYPILSHTPHP
jgi:MFS family permease